jgi:hypothetical protein
MVAQFNLPESSVNSIRLCMTLRYKFPARRKLTTRDPFFKAIGSTITVMVIFVLSIVGGLIIASMTAKTKDAKQAVTGLAAVVIFLSLFFWFRK